MGVASLGLHLVTFNTASALTLNGTSPVTYITDIEGKDSKWRDFLTNNPDIWRDPGTGELRLKPGSTFVYGGDAIDQGPEGMQIVSELLGLKRKYPGQVILIAGNRDLNKLRLPAELSPEAMKKIPTAICR